jgi:hypothetical protein
MEPSPSSPTRGQIDDPNLLHQRQQFRVRPLQPAPQLDRNSQLAEQADSDRHGLGAWTLQFPNILPMKFGFFSHNPVPIFRENALRFPTVYPESKVPKHPPVKRAGFWEEPFSTRFFRQQGNGFSKDPLGGFGRNNPVNALLKQGFSSQNNSAKTRRSNL